MNSLKFDDGWWIDRLVQPTLTISLAGLQSGRVPIFAVQPGPTETRRESRN